MKALAHARDRATNPPPPQHLFGQRRLALALSTLLAAAALTGCSQTPPTPYAAAYQSALARYPGTAPVADHSIDRFVAFFSHGASDEDASSAESAAGNSPSAAELYADRFYFSDTLVTTENRASALAHLERMRASTGSIQVTVLNRLDDGADVYLVWQMRATFAPVRRTVTSDTIGITHLRFGHDGRIVLHQDFWDASEGLYQHVPVLGSVIHRIRRSFDHDE